MEFAFKSTIWVEDNDLDEMARQVRAGAKFDDIYDEIMRAMMIWNTTIVISLEKKFKKKLKKDLTFFTISGRIKM